MALGSAFLWQEHGPPLEDRVRPPGSRTLQLNMLARMRQPSKPRGPAHMGGIGGITPQPQFCQQLLGIWHLWGPRSGAGLTKMNRAQELPSLKSSESDEGIRRITRPFSMQHGFDYFLLWASPLPLFVVKYTKFTILAIFKCPVLWH